MNNFQLILLGKAKDEQEAEEIRARKGSWKNLLTERMQKRGLRSLRKIAVNC